MNETVDFDEIRGDVLASYNDLVKFLQLGVTPLADVTVDGFDLGDKLEDLRQSIVYLCGLTNEDLPALVDQENFSIEVFDPELE